MTVTVRLFATLRERAGTGELLVEVPGGATVRDVWLAVARLHPDLGAAFAGVPAVNRTVAAADTTVGDGDEVAFLPPVSGG
jgi:molybdopterin converting factor subunit 1